ncbi:MAG TPA: hypothetical protein VMH87_16870 [Pseudomonadales bacterium]|nr:hypothetical protein [Pseudomonadales bacterium]
MKLKNFLTGIVLFLTVKLSVFAAIPPAEELLPADTLLVITVPDYQAMHTALQQFPLWLLWNDAAMKPFHDDFMTKWNAKFSASQQQNFGMKLDQFLPMLQGQLTFAVTQNDWQGSDSGSPAILFLMDAKDKSNLLATNLAALKQAWRDSGKTVRTETFQDIKFSVVTFSTNTTATFPAGPPQNVPTDPSQNTLYIGQYKSLLIVGTSVKAVESVAAHLNGGANPALKDNAQFHADQLAHFYNSPLCYGWFNSKTFFAAFSQAQSASSGAMPFAWSSVMEAAGLDDMNSLSFNYRQGRDGTQMEFFANVPASSRKGIFKMLAPEPKDANPPPFVPADAVKFSRWRVDGQQSWAEFEKTLTAISPAALTYLNSLIGMANANAQTQGDPNFDLKKDLIGNLGDDWISYDKAPAGNTLQDINNAPWLFLIGANNADKAALAIKALGGMMSSGTPPQTRDFLGRKIYTISFPSRAPAGAKGAAPAAHSLYCSSSGGYVALSMDASTIENYLRSDDGKTKPLSQVPGLMDAAQHVGGMGNGLFGYQNQRELMRMLFTALKNDPSAGSALFSPLGAAPFATAGNNFQSMVNFALLPDYDRVSKYFTFTVYGGDTTSEGIDLKFFDPRAPGVN